MNKSLTHNSDNFFKLSFFFILLSLILVFSSNTEKTFRQDIYRDTGEKIIFEKVDKERIKKLIEEEKLSDKEGMFYKVIR